MKIFNESIFSVDGVDYEEPEQELTPVDKFVYFLLAVAIMSIIVLIIVNI